MADPSVPVTDGHAPFVYENETFDTYFKVFGQLDGRTRDPLVVLHGGPGLTHDYMLPLSDLATVGIPVILCGQRHPWC
ncbi:L-amino-acid amidase [Rhodofomes roseus]|uniref:L-amino-acid amidase n=1 Tax=Rhodofomes roseus TaxID=34475 RepID=A0ABQ8KBB3_9APHY|nr:L-amino-acid amidase [Rhodofomes roseus]KAH9834554.1 L-amino-acid amidase [Rhodofomes roseus]